MTDVIECSFFTVACQTTLSLPLTFDLEKVLGKILTFVLELKPYYLALTPPPNCPAGDYYHHAGEACDAVQESLSSSSLRRKLFLDGQGGYSGSDSSGPPTPERSYTRQESPPLKQVHGAAEEEAVSSVIDSPLVCGRVALTPSTVRPCCTFILEQFVCDDRFINKLLSIQTLEAVLFLMAGPVLLQSHPEWLLS